MVFTNITSGPIYGGRSVGTHLEGKKDILGVWLGATESSKYWLNVLTTLKNRGVKDILIVSVDDLRGFNIKPKKLVFDYDDISSFFSLGTTTEEMKKDVIKVLSY